MCQFPKLRHEGGPSVAIRTRLHRSPTKPLDIFESIYRLAVTRLIFLHTYLGLQQAAIPDGPEGGKKERKYSSETASISKKLEPQIFIRGR